MTCRVVSCRVVCVVCVCCVVAGCCIVIGMCVWCCELFVVDLVCVICCDVGLFCGGVVVCVSFVVVFGLLFMVWYSCCVLCIGSGIVRVIVIGIDSVCVPSLGA